MPHTAESIQAEFVCRETAARLMEISVDTWDIWVREGYAPPPAIRRGHIVRWHWPTIKAAFVSPNNTDADPFMKGVANAHQKACGRGTS